MSTAEESADSLQPLRSGSPVIEALVTAGIGVGVLLLARLAMLVTVRSFTVTAAGVFAVLLDWGVLIWIVLLAGITVWRSVGTDRPRTGLAVVAAAIGAAVSLGFLAIPSIQAMGWGSLMWFLPQQIVRAGAVLAGGAIGAHAAAAILRSSARPIRRRILIGGGFVALGLAVILIIALFWHYLDAWWVA